MNLSFRTSLAAGLLLTAVASASVAGSAQASESHGSSSKAAAKSENKACKKQGKNYKVQGVFSGGELTRVAGGASERRGDDRYSGTIVVDVASGNRRGQRDVGLRSYAVSGIKTFGITTDGGLPAEGASVELVGKLKAPCAAGARRSADDESPADEVEEDAVTQDAESEDESGDNPDRSGDDEDAATSEDDQPLILDAVTDVNVRVVRFRTS